MEQTIQILIADDHPLIRQSLHWVLDLHHDLAVVGEAPDGETAVELAKQLKPDVVLMDYDMPGMNGVEATRQILADNPAIRVIGFSMHEESGVPDAMWQAGVSAYLLKSKNSSELLAIIRHLSGRGDSVIRDRRKNNCRMSPLPMGERAG